MPFIWAIKIDGNQQAVKVSLQRSVPPPLEFWQFPVDLLSGGGGGDGQEGFERKEQRKLLFSLSPHSQRSCSFSSSEQLTFFLKMKTSFLHLPLRPLSEVSLSAFSPPTPQD